MIPCIQQFMPLSVNFRNLPTFGVLFVIFTSLFIVNATVLCEFYKFLAIYAMICTFLQFTRFWGVFCNFPCLFIVNATVFCLLVSSETLVVKILCSDGSVFAVEA